MSWRAQNGAQDAKIRSARGTRSDCLIPEPRGIQRCYILHKGGGGLGSGLLPYVMCGRLGAKGVKPPSCEPEQS